MATINFYKRDKLLVSFGKDETIKDGYALLPAGYDGILPKLYKAETDKRIIYDRMEVTQ